MKSFFNFISSRKVISIIVIIYLCGMLVAKTRGNRFQEDEMDNRSVPNMIDYQGKITDDSNNPITDPVSIVFAIYSIDIGGTALWTETHASVTPVDGLVHVLLGSETTFGDDLFDGSDRWLSINVNSDGEMTPRLRIVSVPYAIHAKTADTDNDWTIDGSDMYSANSGNVGINDTTPSYQLDVNGDFRVAGILHDSGGDAGISGQVLSTTGTGTDWVNAVGGAEEINDLTDGKTGGNSVFLGSDSGANDDGIENYNVGVGNMALYANTGGQYNTASGYQALCNNSTGNYNTANGAYTLFYNAGSYNTAFGMNALCFNASGEYNVGIGYQTNAYNQEGSQNTIIGYQAGVGTSAHNKSGDIFLGFKAGYNETGSNKLYIENSDSSSPLIYGEFDNDKIVINGEFQATGITRDSGGDAGTSGQVLSSTVTGTNWVDAISGDGHSLDAADGDPTDVVYVNNDGKVGINDTTPSYQLDVDGEINISSGSAYKIDGKDVLQNRGTENIFIGDNAGHNNSGHSNAFIGHYAGASNTDGKCNVFLGKDSGQNNTIGNYNSYLGSYSGYLSTGEQNIFVGSYSGRNTTGSNNVFLGFEAGYDETGSNKLYIESSRSITPLIYGEFDNDYVKINGGFEVSGTLYDDDHDAGTSGQVLSSTSTGTDWVDAAGGAEEINDLTDGKTGGNSVFLGSNAGINDDGSDNSNVGVGISALFANTEGYCNTANGYETLCYNSSGYNNTANGYKSLYHNSTGYSNTANGYQALNTNSTGICNTANGAQALYTNSTGYYNTANGAQALYYNTGSDNTAFGSYALNRNTTGEFNVGLGLGANHYNQEGSQNTIIGYNAGRGTVLHNKSGNIFLGFQAGYGEIGDNKLYIENSWGLPLIYGEFDNDYVRINGDFQATGELRDSDDQPGTNGQVLSSTSTGTNWVDAENGDITAVTAGTGLIGGGTSGDVTLNVDLAGSGSATTVSRSDHNHEIDDLTDGKTGGNSVFLGSNAGLNDDGISNYNVGVGISALRINISGIYNTANGTQALYYNTGSYNTAFGSFALSNNTSGGYNVGIGMDANRYNQTGSRNTIIGYRAGRGTSPHDKSGNVFLGYQAGYNETGNNKLYIDNSSTITPLIYGEFDNDKIVINGEFQATGITRDSGGDAGTNGQVLSSTGAGTNWVDAVDVPLNLSGNVSSPNSVIKGENTGTGYGVYGKHNSSGNYGLLGVSNCGVYGYNTTLDGYGVYGNSTGLYAGYFKSSYNSDDTHVIHAEYTGTGSNDPYAVYGKSRPQDWHGLGGYFEGGYGGVTGKVNPTGSYSYHGVYGCVDGGSGTNYAIYGYATDGSINYAGYFSGNVTVTGTFINPSDERFKENVQPFRNALSKIKLMNVHTFNFKQIEKEKQLVLPKGEQIGLIAQELEEILPELVKDNVHAYDKNEGIEGAKKDVETIEYKGINYIGLIPVLIEAIKEQQQQIEELKQQIAELK